MRAVSWLFPLSLVWTSAAAAQHADGSAAPATGEAALDLRLRSAVTGAGRWIASHGRPAPGGTDGLVFGANDGAPPAVIYGGTAGVLVFAENAAAALDDADLRALADRTHAGLMALARDGDGGRTWAAPGQGEGAAALYVGDAGVGAALLVRARLRRDDAALTAATAVGDALLARGKREGEGAGEELHWDQQIEVIYGAAGTALFLLELADELARRERAPDAARFRSAAHAVGRYLIAEGEQLESAPPQRRWRWQLGGNRLYTGFSHGTAGVVYALARIGAACADADCTAAAVEGARWLGLQARRDGALLSWPVAPGTPMTMGGWCHGPPGTARALLLLASVTGDDAYRNDALASVRWLVAQAGPEDAATAPDFPPSLCCGVAGAVDFCCDLYRATGDEAHRAFARRAARWLLDRAVVDDDGVRWLTGRNAHGSAADRAPLDLMLGAAGEALALLRVLVIDRPEDPIVHLPDRAIPALAPPK